MLDPISLIVGALLGAGIVIAVILVRRGRERSQWAEEMEARTAQLGTVFEALSRRALSQNADDFLKLARTQLDQQTAVGSEALDTKKKLIDATLTEIKTRLGELQLQTQTSDKERRESTGAIKTELARTAETTKQLNQTTTQLREALASPQRRGQWGERMAEDVLRAIGFVENLNYRKQTVIAGGTRPDFTFLLPGDLILHMDVKFPLENYQRAVEATEEALSSTHRASFLKDVRKQVKDVASRDYIDADAGTVDCALLFIPNEQIYSYIHEHDVALFDEAIDKKVILCSPLTLYAVLVVIRQAVSNFSLQKATHQILTLLGEFRKEWGRYCETVDSVDRSLQQTVSHFEKLKTTRTRKLDRQLDRIDDLQQSADATSPRPLSLEEDALSEPRSPLSEPRP